MKKKSQIDKLVTEIGKELKRNRIRLERTVSTKETLDIMLGRVQAFEFVMLSINKLK